MRRELTMVEGNPAQQAQPRPTALHVVAGLVGASLGMLFVVTTAYVTYITCLWKRARASC